MANRAPGLYAVTITNRGGRGTGHTSLIWHGPFAAPNLARAHGKRLVEAGEATLAFVVSIGADGHGKIMIGSTHPYSARRVIEHYEQLWGQLEPPEENP